MVILVLSCIVVLSCPFVLFYVLFVMLQPAWRIPFKIPSTCVHCEIKKIELN